MVAMYRLITSLLGPSRGELSEAKAQSASSEIVPRCKASIFRPEADRGGHAMFSDCGLRTGNSPASRIKCAEGK